MFLLCIYWQRPLNHQTHHVYSCHVACVCEMGFIRRTDMGNRTCVFGVTRDRFNHKATPPPLLGVNGPGHIFRRGWCGCGGYGKVVCNVSFEPFFMLRNIPVLSAVRSEIWTTSHYFKGNSVYILNFFHLKSEDKCFFYAFIGKGL